MNDLFSVNSLLFTPAHKMHLFHKSIDCAADILIVDLEDSLPINEKFDIHTKLEQCVNLGNGYTFGYRINSVKSKFGLKDILFLQNTKILPAAIILPVVESANEVKIIRELLPSIKLIATLESPAGVLHVEDIAAVSDGLIFGSADYSARFAIVPTADNLLHPRNMISIAAAAAGIPAFDTACFSMKDMVELEEECILVKKLGFTGKAAIHPNQIETINRLLKYNAKEVSWANDVIAHDSKSSNAVSSLNDSMIGPPFIDIAKTILKRTGGNCV